LTQLAAFNISGGCMIDSEKTFRIIPADNEVKRAKIVDFLHDDQKKSIAGEESGNVSTQFKRSMKNVCEYLEKNGPTSTEVLFDSIVHHYKKKKSLANALQRYNIHTFKNDEGLWEYSEEEIDKSDTLRW
jgi:hypothetical protein